MNPPLQPDRATEAMMIKNVMARLDGTRADNARLVTTGQIAEYFDSHVVGLLLLKATACPQPNRPGALTRRAP